MQMDAEGRRYLILGDYRGTNGRLRVVRNNELAMQNGNWSNDLTSDNYVESFNNRYLNNTIAVDQAGDWYAAASNMTASNDSSFTFYARRAAANNNGTTGAYKRIIMRISNNGFADQDRVKYPRVYAYNTNGTNGTTTGTNDAATRIFMSYYDNNSSNNDNLVIFQYGMVGAPANNVTNGNGWGGNLFGHNDAQTYTTPANDATNATTGVQVVARST
jgi:hypothetical protein